MALSVVAAVVGVAFAAVVAMRWARSRRPAFAAWAGGLLIFGIAAGAQAVGQARGFDATTFRIFYLFGGVLGVIYLALGTVFLLAPVRVARWVAVVLALLTVIVAVDAAIVPVDSMKLQTPAGVLGTAITGHGNPLYIAAVVFNIVGSLVLIGGSAWSAYSLLRTRAGVDRVVCNVLLALGAFLIAAGFSAAKTVGGSLDALGGYEAVGITIMFAGFLSLGRIGSNGPRRGTLRARQPADA